LSKDFSVKAEFSEGGSRIHGEVDFSCDPLLADLGEQNRYQAKEGRFDAEEIGETGVTFEFLNYMIRSIACSEAFLADIPQAYISVRASLSDRAYPSSRELG